MTANLAKRNTRRTPERAQSDLSTLIDSAEDLIWSVDLNYTLLALNSALKRYFADNFGASAEIGMRPEELLPPEQAQRWTRLYDRAINEGPFSIESLRADGRTIQLNLNPIKVDSETTGISVFGRDITDLKKAQQAQLDAERKYRSIFDGAVEGIFQSTFDGQVLTANTAMAKMLGYDSPDEAMASVHNVVQDVWVDPKERARYIQIVRQSPGNQALGYECRFKRKDGSIIWVSLSGRIVVGSDGQSLHHEGFVVDITESKMAETQIRESEELYRTAFQTSLDAVAINRMSDGLYIDCNKAFLEITGYERSDVIGHTSIELGIWADNACRNRLRELLLQNSNCRNFETQFRKKNGDQFWGLMSSSLIEPGGVACILSITRDTTDSKEAQELLASSVSALRLSEERYRTVFQTSFDGILINRIDNGVFIDVNPMLLSFMGYEREEVMGRTAQELGLWVYKEDRERMYELLHLNQCCNSFEALSRKKNGETVWALLSASVIQIDGVASLITIARDISHAKAAEDEIRNLAYYDPLTGLPNRRLLLERLRQKQDASKRFGGMRAIMFLDLDHFKTLNDSHGHQTGDLLLKEVASRLTSCVRSTDTVARLGGDEFVVMLEDLGSVPEEAARRAQDAAKKILCVVDRPYVLDGREWTNTSSIGIAVFGNIRQSTEEILQQADIAMYQAKAAGRDAIRLFAPALQAAINSRVSLQKDLRRAVKARQFVLHYQPQMERGEVSGAEALIRWRHPRRGLLGPKDFIPLAEETELILLLGDWVLETACKQLASWATCSVTADLSIAVNVSARQFRQGDFVDQVLTTIHRTGANPKLLRLELTESLLVDNFAEVVAKMTALRAHGLRFSIDDFGTGYSSLTYLRHLPLDQLKIDGSFVRDILVDTTCGAIAQTIISLGKAMNLPVMAEGVESKEQLAFLNNLGCRSFQGYLFSRPLPVRDFELLLSRSLDIAA